MVQEHEVVVEVSIGVGCEVVGSGVGPVVTGSVVVGSVVVGGGTPLEEQALTTER